jgi:hypothetical protein
VVDGELAPVMIVSDGVVYGAHRTMANSNPWSLTAGASRGDGEVRLETTTASVVVGESEKLQGKAGKTITRRPRERGEGGGARGETGMLHHVGINGDWRRNL